MSMRRFVEDLLKKSGSGVPCLRRASFAEVATEAEAATRLRAEALQRASAQAGRPVVVLTSSMYGPSLSKP